MKEAGYPDGVDEQTGEPLVIDFNAKVTMPKAQLKWLTRKLQDLGITLNVEISDYSRFQDKMKEGSFQIFSWGWYNDYPDPENNFFLLYGGNAQMENESENHANYISPEFDELFRQMEHMDDTPERFEVCQKMNKILQHDVPWLNVWYTISYFLCHKWVKNVKPNFMANNRLKYYRIVPKDRAVYVKKHNRPELWVVYVFFLVLILISLPAVIIVRRRMMKKQ